MRTPHRLGRLLATTALLALAACGGGSDSTSQPPPTGGSPSPGTGAQFVALGTSSHTVSLAWKAPDQAATYSVERKSGNGTYAQIATLSAGTGSYLDEGLARSTSYSYRLVAAGNGAQALGESNATTGTEDAVVTPAGTLLDQANGKTVGAAGGQISSPDGLITLDVPPGAFGAATEMVATALTNTAPDGRDNGVKIHLAAAPGKPLTLHVKYDDAIAHQADGLRIALQRADGSWLSLPLTQTDKATRTLTSVLPAELLARPRTQQAASAHNAADVSVDFTVVKYLALYLAPRQAQVAVKGTLGLVPYARVRGYETEIGTCITLDEGVEACVMQPVMETRQVPFLNTKAGFTRAWYVFLQEGGDATYGTVVTNGSVGATYTAPRKVPDPSTVVASFQSTNNRTGQTVVLASGITIIDDQWVGTMSAVDGPSGEGTTIFTQADLSWHLDDTASNAGARVYRPEGTLGVVITDNDCTASVTPSEQPVSADPQLVSLDIDDSVSPARYRARLITFWPAVIHGSCPGGSTSRNTLAGWGWDVHGTVSGDGNTIAGSAMQDTARIEWSFHR